MQVAPEQVPGLGQAGNQPAPGTEQTPQQQPGQGESSYSQLAGDFLKGVPDTQKPLIEPFVKQWDAQVTKKFQELHSQYEPYKNLGSPETLQQAMQIYQILDQNPKAVYDMLAQEFGTQTPTSEQGPGTEQQVPEGFEGIPPQLLSRLDTQEQVLQKLAEFVLGSQQQQQESEEDSRLQSYLDQLKQQHGEFDEDWVVMQISKGMDGDKAVAAWNTMIQDQVNKAGSGQKIPPILGGGGVVPQETFDPKTIPSKDVRELVAGLMKNVHAEGS